MCLVVHVVRKMSDLLLSIDEGVPLDWCQEAIEHLNPEHREDVGIHLGERESGTNSEADHLSQTYETTTDETVTEGTVTTEPTTTTEGTTGTEDPEAEAGAVALARRERLNSYDSNVSVFSSSDEDEPDISKSQRDRMFWAYKKRMQERNRLLQQRESSFTPYASSSSTFSSFNGDYTDMPNNSQETHENSMFGALELEFDDDFL